MPNGIRVYTTAHISFSTPCLRRSLPPPRYRYLQELTVRVESLTNLGEGIAREGDTKWVVMVPHVIPGELVKCKVFRNHANYSEATLVRETSHRRSWPMLDARWRLPPLVGAARSATRMKWRRLMAMRFRIRPSAKDAKCLSLYRHRYPYPLENCATLRGQSFFNQRGVQ